MSRQGGHWAGPGGEPMLGHTFQIIMVVHLIANAHLDPIWLWNWQAGVDEALATFRSAVDRCHEYPEMKYTRGEAWVYQWVEELDPGLFAEVGKLVAAGRWSIAGGQFVQPDANLPTAAGWRKQLELGRRYFADRFGASPKVGYNVDTFGHPATLPDLLAEAGYDGYVFHRPNEQQVSLPRQTFRWRGSGGGEVIAFRIAPCYVTRSDEIAGQLDLSVQAADPELGHTMMFYGLGNHGGGPTKATIEWLLRERDRRKDIELRFSTVDDFFEAARGMRDNLPVLDIELQRTFPGCYSVMHGCKQMQHRSERLLEQAAEMAGAFSAGDGECQTTIARLDEAWKDLAFTQFHDVLAGTSIPTSYISARHMQGRAAIVGEEEIVRVSRRFARRRLARTNEQRIVMLNANADAFEGAVECEPFIDFDDWNGRWFADERGEAVPFQLVESEANMGMMIPRVVLPVAIPARGFRVFELRARAEGVAADFPAPAVGVDGKVIDNGILRVQLGDSGIRSLIFGKRELLGRRGWSLQMRHDHGDTWVFHQSRFDEEITAGLAGLEWTLEDEGPLRARLFADAVMGGSRLRLGVTLYAGQPELHLHLRVVFSEEHKMLQMPLHLATAPVGWTSGLAGGEVERTPGPDEMPFCGWDAVKLGGLGLTLGTPDAYSTHLQDDAWQFSLLRSPLMAWAGQAGLKPAFSRAHSDQGEHSFHFVMRVGEGFEPADAHRLAERMAKPPVVFDHYEGMNRPAWANSPPRRLWTPDIPHARSLGHMKHLDDMAEGPGNWEESGSAS